MIKPDKLIVDLLSKEDLIRIIAQMHDIIQEWDNGYGVSSDDAQALMKVGESSREWCNERGWEYDLDYAVLSYLLKNKKN